MNKKAFKKKFVQEISHILTNECYKEVIREYRDALGVYDSKKGEIWIIVDKLLHFARDIQITARFDIFKNLLVDLIVQVTCHELIHSCLMPCDEPPIFRIRPNEPFAEFWDRYEYVTDQSANVLVNWSYNKKLIHVIELNGDKKV